MLYILLYSIIHISGFVLAAPANNCLKSVNAFLTSPYNSWLPVVLTAIFAIILIMALIYGISSFAGNTGFKTWTRIKIYEVLLSLILIMIYASVSTMFCTFNPVSIYTYAGLVSPNCSSAPLVNNLYSLAICDMSEFAHYTAQMNQGMSYFLLLNVIQPAFAVKWSTGIHAGFTVSINAPSIEIFPANTVFKYLGGMLTTIYLLTLINQIQLILLSASVLIFAILMAIGLIARSFGVTRTFGGAMIAFALGIGFIYPMLVTVTYGFLDYGLYTVNAAFVSNLNPFTSPVPWAGAALAAFFYLTGPLVGGTLAGLAVFLKTAIPEYVYYYLGFISMGMTLIPLLNFVILDTFILDFSRSVGERMDFLSLLTRIL